MTRQNFPRQLQMLTSKMSCSIEQKEFKPVSRHKKGWNFNLSFSKVSMHRVIPLYNRRSKEKTKFFGDHACVYTVKKQSEVPFEALSDSTSLQVVAVIEMIKSA